MNINRISILVYIILVIALILLIRQGSIIANGIIAQSIQVLSVLLMVWARITFGRRSFHAGAEPTEGGLITTGPYRFIRHPIYASILYFFWAAIITNWTLINAGIGVVVTFCLVIRMIAEEKLVALKYPDYESYSSCTKRIIPYVI